MFRGAFKSCLQDLQCVSAVGGKVRRCLSRVSLEGETTEVGGSLLCTLFASTVSW